ncbi:MAG: hypothetical protein IKJ23_06130 [Bacteroidaceae bacterium]|nr:hypothetical protein [Bacteroidaceae bacterium]
MENRKSGLSYKALAYDTGSEWRSARGLNDMFDTGCYKVRLSHSDVKALGLDCDSCIDEHYIVAYLFITESGTDDKLQKGRIIGQTILLTNCTDGTMQRFTRKCTFAKDGPSWNRWERFPDADEIGEIAAGLGKSVVWGSGTHADAFVTAGTYNIKGERTVLTDGLPIANAAAGHTINAKLVVLDSSISGNGANDDKCITQILTLSNRTGGDGEIYVRTGRASSKNLLAGGYGWEQWAKLQQNVQVGQVTSLDGYIENGMYSGVYTDGTSFETFVMVVINNYAVAGANGKVRSVSQFKYALALDGMFSYRSRSGQGNTGISWGEWSDLNGATTAMLQDGAVTAQKLSDDVREKVDNPLRPLFIAAGARYNSVTGFYSLNGVYDLSEEQILLCYIYKDVVYRLNVARVLQNISLRAIFPYVGAMQVSQIFKNTPFNGTGSLSSTKIEVFKTVLGINDINSIELDRMLPCEHNSIWAATFHNCVKLRDVWPINVSNVSRMANDTFLNCISLVELRLYNQKCNLPIQYSPQLSKDSVQYIIKNASPATAVTITLHPDAYSRLADDADVVAALEAQPLISLVSA